MRKFRLVKGLLKVTAPTMLSTVALGCAARKPSAPPRTPGRPALPVGHGPRHPVNQAGCGHSGAGQCGLRATALELRSQ